MSYLIVVKCVSVFTFPLCLYGANEYIASNVTVDIDWLLFFCWIILSAYYKYIMLISYSYKDFINRFTHSAWKNICFSFHAWTPYRKNVLHCRMFYWWLKCDVYILWLIIFVVNKFTVTLFMYPMDENDFQSSTVFFIHSWFVRIIFLTCSVGCIVLE
jgi:hypothetical protein